MTRYKYHYQEIEQDIRNKIQNNIYQVGETIPKELDLAKEYNVSRPTIRKAITNLVNDGLVIRKKKLGTRVVSKKITSNFTNFIESYNDDISNNQNIPTTQVIRFDIVRANNLISNTLNISLNEPVYKLVRLRFANATPIVFVTTYIPKYFFPNLMDYDFSKCSLYSSFSELGKPIDKVKRHLEIELSDNTVSNLLDIPNRSPLFLFKSMGYDNLDNCIEYSIAQYRGDLNSFDIEIQK